MLDKRTAIAPSEVHRHSCPWETAFLTLFARGQYIGFLCETQVRCLTTVHFQRELAHFAIMNPTNKDAQSKRRLIDSTASPSNAAINRRVSSRSDSPAAALRRWAHWILGSFHFHEPSNLELEALFDHGSRPRRCRLSNTTIPPIASVGELVPSRTDCPKITEGAWKTADRSSTIFRWCKWPIYSALSPAARVSAITQRLWLLAPPLHLASSCIPPLHQPSPPLITTPTRHVISLCVADL
jgi:hypothetical protein